MLGKLIATAAIVFLVPISSPASDIRQRPFTYTFDAAVSRDRDVFVVCSDCPDNKLSPQPVAPKLAVRMSSTPAVPADTPVEQVTIETRKPEKPDTQGIIGTVHFEFDSSKLTHLEQSKLEKLSSVIPAEKPVNVTGFTCSIGSGEYNRKLSFRRAQAVATVLKAKGVNISTIEGSGKCCPVSQDKRMNRRVEIIGQQKEEM